ncbi:hypothetical protein ACQ86N_23660 [Puia sp. P3]
MNRLGGDPEKADSHGGEHPDLPLQVLGDVMCSFIRGIQAQENENDPAA